MEAFVRHTGVVAPLLRNNIDTDAIIPSREMKQVSKQGLGDGLFAGWRYVGGSGRTPEPDFVLNQPAYAGASILLAGENFGCGSSREHAVWALKEFGIRAIVAVGFGSIFYNNCIRNGILPLVLPEPVIVNLHGALAPGARLTIDLPAQQLLSASGQVHDFAIAPQAKRMLIEGLDAIGLTLELAADIDAFEQRHQAAMPWLMTAKP